MPGLPDLLVREAALVADFVAVLEDEQAALTQGRMEPLSDLAARKAVLAEQLNDLDARRDELLSAGGLGGGRDGMAAWLTAQAGDAGTAAWERLQSLARQARALNDLNGKLIALRLQATGEALATLTRQAQQAGLYGRDGQAAQITGSRIIDSA